MERVARLLGPGTHRRIPSRAWLLAALFLFLAGVAYQQAIVSLLLRLAFGRFVYSTSNAGVLLVLVSLSAATLILAQPARPFSRHGARVPRHFKYLLTAIFSGHLVHAIALSAWSHQLGIARRARTYSWIDGEQTFMTLTHSHLGKTGLTRLTQLLPSSEWLREYDMGSPLSPFMTSFTSFLIVLTSALALGFFLHGLYSLRSTFRRDLWQAAAYLFSGLSCIQLMIDGGPLALRLGPSLVVLLSIVLARPQETWVHTFHRIRFPAGAFLLTQIVVWCVLSGKPMGFALVSLAPQVAGYAFMVGMSSVWVSQTEQSSPSLRPRMSRRRLSVLCATFIVFGAGVARDLSSEIFPLFAARADSDRVFEVDLDTGTIQELTASLKERSAISIYDRAGDPLKPRNIFISRAQDREAETGGLFAVLNAGFPQTGSVLAGGDAFRINGLYPTREDMKGWILDIGRVNPGLPPIGRIGGDVIDRNNRYVWLRVLDASLREAKINKYIVVPIEQGPNSQTSPIRKAGRSEDKRRKGTARSA